MVLAGRADAGGPPPPLLLPPPAGDIEAMALTRAGKNGVFVINAYWVDGHVGRRGRPDVSHSSIAGPPCPPPDINSARRVQTVEQLTASGELDCSGEEVARIDGLSATRPQRYDSRGTLPSSTNRSPSRENAGPGLGRIYLFQRCGTEVRAPNPSGRRAMTCSASIDAAVSLPEPALGEAVMQETGGECPRVHGWEENGRHPLRVVPGDQRTLGIVSSEVPPVRWTPTLGTWLRHSGFREREPQVLRQRRVAGDDPGHHSPLGDRRCRPGQRRARGRPGVRGHDGRSRARRFQGCRLSRSTPGWRRRYGSGSRATRPSSSYGGTPRPSSSPTAVSAAQHRSPCCTTCRPPPCRTASSPR